MVSTLITIVIWEILIHSWICFMISVEQLFNRDMMTTPDGFPASFYGEPGVLGMLSNGISAFLVLLQNFSTAHTGIAPVGVENILAGKSFRNYAVLIQ